MTKKENFLCISDGTNLVYSNKSYETPGETEVIVPLVEGDWWKLGDELTLASRAQLMDVLRDLQAVLIRAHFHGDQDEVRKQF